MRDVPEPKLNGKVLCINSIQPKREYSDSSLFVDHDSLDLFEKFVKLYGTTIKDRSGELLWNQYIRKRMNRINGKLDWTYNCKLGPAHKTMKRLCPILRYERSEKPIASMHFNKLNRYVYDMWFNNTSPQEHETPKCFKDIFDRHIIIDEDDIVSFPNHGG